MAASQMSEVLQHLRRALGDGAELTDGQLLEGYISRRDEAAFAALVRRHGPMVWGVCRRALRNHHDAEDAFQTTFLVLARRAASIASRELLANWLYGVAHRTALKARATGARRKGRERQVAEIPEPAGTQRDPWRDVQPALDEELSRLPGRYRGVLVLCDLEGKTRKEAAVQLGCPEGTVASRLARARTMLARRLTQRGVALSGGAVSAVLAQQAMSAGVLPSSVMDSTVKAAGLPAAKAAATGAISVHVAALTEGVLKAMLFSKLKTATALLSVVLGLGALAGGMLLFTNSAKAIPWWPFTDTKTHVEKATDIVIAECLTDTANPGIDGIAPYEVNVVAVIKGKRKLGKVRVGSDGLEKGRSYMLTSFRGASFMTNGELAVVELPPKFSLASLRGKTPDQQVQAIFDARRIWVTARMEALSLEKKRLEKAVNKVIKPGTQGMTP
jgi:RNA polymerase sigma factor (sigma-70 family)